MKAYLCLFTCLATRAAHLELVEDYISESFLAAFTRFTCRRGHCALIRSDRGTNFIGADKELRSLFEEFSAQMATIIPSLATLGTKWVFNPPSAPHFGGAWESMVKAAKFHLRRIIGDNVLNYSEFNTLLCRIEAALISRPLSRITDDTEDWVLTPAYFFIQRPSFVVPEPFILTEKVPASKRWEWIRQLSQIFWSKWSKDYLKSLVERQKWFRPARELQPGDLVLIKDDLFAPTHWLMGKVKEVKIGANAQSCMAIVKTAKSIITRPVVKLILLLPANQDVPEEV